MLWRLQVYNTQQETLLGLSKATGAVVWNITYPQDLVWDVIVDPAGVVYYLTSIDGLTYTLYGVEGLTGKQTMSFTFSVAYNLYQDCSLPLPPQDDVLLVLCNVNVVAIQVPPYSPPKSDGATGPIVGGVVGGLVVIGAAVLGLKAWRSKRGSRMAFAPLVSNGVPNAETDAADVATDSNDNDGVVITHTSSSGVYRS